MDDLRVVPDFLRYWAGRTPDKAAFIFRAPDSNDRHVLRYGDLYLLAGRWARVLHDKGIGPGHFVVNALPNSPEHAAVEFGILMSGAASVDGSRFDLTDASDLVNTLSQSRASCLVIDPDFFGERRVLSANQTRWKQASSGFGSPQLEKMDALKSHFLSGPNLDGSVGSKTLLDLKFVFTIHRRDTSPPSKGKHDSQQWKTEILNANGYSQADFTHCSLELFNENVDFLTALKKQDSLTLYHAVGNEEDVCTVFTTSGTTGPPKLVVFTHHAFVSVAKTYARPPSFEFNCYLMGRAVGYVANSIFKGSTRVLSDNRAGSPADMVEFLFKSVMDEGVTNASLLAVYHQPLADKIAESTSSSSSAFPAESSNMTHSHEKTPQLQSESVAAAAFSHAPDDTRLLRHIGLGSQPVTKQMVQTAGKIAERVFVSYACTELFFIANHIASDPDEYKDYFVGKPLPDVDVRIRGAAGREADAGEHGEIEVKTPYRFREYMHQPDLTSSAFSPDGYFRTGDIGWFDDKGGLYVLGRGGDVITHGNLQIHPGWLEGRIRACPNVKDVLVVGIPHTVLINELCACVVLVSADVTLTTVQKFVEDDVSVQREDLLSARPRYYLDFDTFPLTPAGKVDRRQVQRMAMKQLGKDM